MVDLVATAQRLADDVLFPHALETDQSREVPTAMLDQIAAAGLYGLHSSGVDGRAESAPGVSLSVLEALASGCLTTAFVWAQHAGAAKASAADRGAVHARWASVLASGDKRGGVAFAYLLRPGQPMMAATPTGSGWLFSGSAPFVTGWGHIDALLIAARHGDDIVWAVIDAKDSETMTSRRLELAAVNGSVTVELTLRNQPILTDEVTAVQPFNEWHDAYRQRLRDNGSLALGVTRRTLSLLGPSTMDDELTQCRTALDNSNLDNMAKARAATTSLGVRASAALIASAGGAGMSTEHHGQRLARESLFLVVQGQTRAVQNQHMQNFTQPGQSLNADR